MEDILKCLQVIIKRKEIEMESLPKAIKMLDEILLDDSIEIHPRLRHFLQNRSYEKAWVWLNDGIPEKGTCGN